MPHRPRLLTVRRAAGAALALVAAAAIVSAPVPAQAALPDPFGVFDHCPAEKMVADGLGDGGCLTAVVTGGTFTIGKGTVPITAPSTLSEGTTTAADGTVVTITPTDGGLFTSSPMQVPGGLLGVNGLERLLPGLTDITATVEYAGTKAPEINVLNAIFGGGTVVDLPIKIRLRNALLGDNCYIGSNANPIVLSLTAETTNPPAPNTPISGKLGSFDYITGPGGLSMVKGSGAVLVDNSFSVPGATGCGLAGTLNSVVNARQGLPAPAGQNTAILNEDSYLGGPASAIAAQR